MLGEKIIKEMENDKEDYKRKEERRKIREVKE
jgi:hypothetical protein